MRLSDPVTPYTGPALRLPADPPDFLTCGTCSTEWTPKPHDDLDDECPACQTARRLIHDCEDEAIRLIRELEDEQGVGRG